MLLYFLLLQHFVIIQILTACPLFLFPRVFVDFKSAFSSVATFRDHPDFGRLPIVPVSSCFRRLYLCSFFCCNSSWSSRCWHSSHCSRFLVCSSTIPLYFLLFQQFLVTQMLAAFPLLPFPRGFVDYASVFSSVATFRDHPDFDRLPIVPVSSCFRRL